MNKIHTMKPHSSAQSAAERHIFTSSMKMSEMIDSNFGLVVLLTRTGVGFGFGNMTVDEACRKAGCDTETFLLICNTYTFDGYIPSEGQLAAAKADEVVNYLRASHEYYVRSALKTLEDCIARMLEPSDDKLKKIIWKFYFEYKDEIVKHFEYEETRVFPYVADILMDRKQSDYDMEQYEENHSNIEEKLDDLKNIIMKYLPTVCDNNLISNTLYMIYYLNDDLDKHREVEENLLVPMVNLLEKNEKSE